MTKLAIVGATGVVGRSVLKILEEEKLNIDEYVLFASEKSKGKKIKFMGKNYKVKVLNEKSFSKTNKIDYAIFSAGSEVAKKYALIAAKNGTIVIDNSNAFRMNKNVPLIVPEVNGKKIKENKGIIANPNCSTIQAVVPLKVLDDSYKIKRIVYSTYQAVSGAGRDGILDLENGILDYLKNNINKNEYLNKKRFKIKNQLINKGENIIDEIQMQKDKNIINEIQMQKDKNIIDEIEMQKDKNTINEIQMQKDKGTINEIEKSNYKLKKFRHPIFNNVLPHIDIFEKKDYTKEEIKMINETRKILNKPNLKVTATCVRVPVFNSHAESINVEFENDFSIDELKEKLKKAKGIKLIDNPKEEIYPIPTMATGTNDVYVGRVRRDYSVPYGINMWVVSDNIRKGAAANAVQILKEII